MKILKFGLPDPMVHGARRIIVSMPMDARILWCDVQHGDITMWALCGSGEERKIREFEIYATGADLGDIRFLDYIGTVQLPPFVWHIFEKKSLIPL